MNVCVIGTGHFASIVAAVLSSMKHVVTLSDEVPRLRRTNQIPPEDEPGYIDLTRKGMATKHLVPALDSVDIYWIAYDVPLNDKGGPETAEVERRIIGLDSRAPKEIPFLVSCQWPVGTTRRLSEKCHGREFIYVMENVRVNRAVADFASAPFPLVGANSPVSSLANKFIDHRVLLMPMTWESAEMAKHATNAFMALQVAFANEIACVCRHVGADADVVMQGVMCDARVSDKAPLRPGAPFGGGSLQRDLMVLETLTDAPIIHAIRKSNDSR